MLDGFQSVLLSQLSKWLHTKNFKLLHFSFWCLHDGLLCHTLLEHLKALLGTLITVLQAELATD
jgi:hypothetical protein